MIYIYMYTHIYIYINPYLCIVYIRIVKLYGLVFGTASSGRQQRAVLASFSPLTSIFAKRGKVSGHFACAKAFPGLQVVDRNIEATVWQSFESWSLLMPYLPTWALMWGPVIHDQSL